MRRKHLSDTLLILNGYPVWRLVLLILGTVIVAPMIWLAIKLGFLQEGLVALLLALCLVMHEWTTRKRFQLILDSDYGTGTGTVYASRWFRQQAVHRFDLHALRQAVEVVEHKTDEERLGWWDDGMIYQLGLDIDGRSGTLMISHGSRGEVTRAVDLINRWHDRARHRRVA